MSVRGSANSANFGTLYVVATPIGNLGDISERARQTLGAVDLIAAEDTRHSGHLLQALGIARPLVSLHEHNEASRSDELIARIVAGANVALISDAGTPLISDPGFELVQRARAAGVKVVGIPGACAAIVALSIAGLPTDRFAFEGFLPSKQGARRSRLTDLQHETRTLVFYEAPHRVRETLADLRDVFGAGRHVVVARELTKVYESAYEGTLASLAGRAQTDEDMSRGEVVIVVAGAEQSASVDRIKAEAVLKVLLEELSAGQAAKLGAKLTGMKRNELYDLALKLSPER